jgi:hypothetical protein
MAIQYAAEGAYGVYGPFATRGTSTTTTTDAVAFTDAYGGTILTLLDPTASTPVVEQPNDNP